MLAFKQFLVYFVGDLGGSSVQDEVGGEEDSKIHAELPNSPLSSGGFCQFSSKGLVEKT